MHVLPRQRFITSASVPSSPLRRPLFLPSQLYRNPSNCPRKISGPSFNFFFFNNLPFDISSTCCTYSLPLQCMILPPPRGDPSPLLPQSSSRLRRPERPKQKARCAPSLAAILAGSVARLVTCPLSLSPWDGDPRCPVCPLYTSLANSPSLIRPPPPPPPLEMRRTAERRRPLRDVYTSPPPMPRLWPEAPRLAQGTSRAAHGRTSSSVSHFFSSRRRTIMSLSSVRRSRISWRRRE